MTSFSLSAFISFVHPVHPIQLDTHRISCQSIPTMQCHHSHPIALGEVAEVLRSVLELSRSDCNTPSIHHNPGSSPASTRTALDMCVKLIWRSSWCWSWSLDLQHCTEAVASALPPALLKSFDSFPDTVCSTCVGRGVGWMDGWWSLLDVLDAVDG